MPAPNRLSQNSYLNYPFKEADYSYGLTWNNSWIVDCGLTYGVSSGYSRSHGTYLSQISVSGGNVTFRLSTDTQDLHWDFTFPVGDGLQTVFTEAKRTVVGSVDPNLGFGYMQVWDTSDLADGVYNGTNAALIESQIQNLNKHYVSAVNVINEYTTAMTEGYEGNTPAAGDVQVQFTSGGTSEDYQLEASDLTGEIELDNGQYADIQFDANNNVITINTITDPRRGGAEPCTDRYKRKSNYNVSVEPACNEMLYTLNGAGPDPSTNVFRFAASRGIEITKESDHHIKVNYDQDSLFRKD